MKVDWSVFPDPFGHFGFCWRCCVVGGGERVCLALLGWYLFWKKNGIWQNEKLWDIIYHLSLVYTPASEQDNESLYIVQSLVPKSMAFRLISDVAAKFGCLMLLALHRDESVSNLQAKIGEKNCNNIDSPDSWPHPTIHNTLFCTPQYIIAI